jgi:hypothetical protein
VDVEIDGVLQRGVTSEGLAPGWFEKTPGLSYDAEIKRMLDAIRLASRLIEGQRFSSVFALWMRLYMGMQAASDAPPLLKSFGISMVERGVIDAFCRFHEVPFADAVRENAFGIDLGSIHTWLSGLEPADLLPADRPSHLFVRHTIGLDDPIREREIKPENTVADGLPQSLEASIQTYGLSYFKIKLEGDVKRDIARLGAIWDVLSRSVNGAFHVTLDANERFTTPLDVRDYLATLLQDLHVQALFDRVLYLEQPLHRDVAFQDLTMARPAGLEGLPIVIDESDGELTSLSRALDAGYAGVSHKNAKGVVKGIANACLLARLRQNDPDHPYLLTGEDFASVGPIAMLQDLAVCSTLGLKHVERNGHHYFTGLRMYPPAVWEQVFAHHSTLYARHEDGFPTVRIQEGRIYTESVLTSPFGFGPIFDPEPYLPIEAWNSDLSPNPARS